MPSIFTTAQVNEVMEKRGCNRKSARQFLRRELKKEEFNPIKDIVMALHNDKPSNDKERPAAKTTGQKTLEEKGLPPAKAAAPAKAPVKKASTPEKDEAPARKTSPTDRIELTPIADSRAYTARRGTVVVCLVERNRAAAAGRWNSLGVSIKAYDEALKASKSLGLPLFVGAQVRVAGRWDSGWLIPATLYKKNLVAESDFNLSKAARIAYAADSESLAGGVQFEITKA